VKLKVQFYTQRKRFEECAQNLTFHVGGAKASLWLRRSRKFVLQNVGGSEGVRSQNQLCAWRCKDWHALHESSYCYFSVYAGTRNLKCPATQGRGGARPKPSIIGARSSCVLCNPLHPLCTVCTTIAPRGLLRIPHHKFVFHTEMIAQASYCTQACLLAI